MKKLILAAVICSAGFISNAQTTQKTKISFGIIAGANLNSLKIDADGLRVHGAGAGYHAGGLMQIQCSQGFAIQPQVLLSQRRAHWMAGDEVTSQITSINMPVNFLYTEKNFYAGGGPSFQYGIDASHKSANIKIDPYAGDVVEGWSKKKFEIGMNLTAGYKLKSGLFFAVSYNHPITELGDLLKEKNHTVGVSAGFVF
jgi:hypothetical protein